MFREPGHGRAGRALEAGGVAISTVNLAEVLDRIAKTAGNVARALDEIRGSELAIVDFTSSHAEHAALVFGPTRRAGLALGDRARLALALERDEAAPTADRAWVAVPHGARVELIR